MERLSEPYHRENPDQGILLDGSFGPVVPAHHIPPGQDTTLEQAGEISEIDEARLMLEALRLAGIARRNEPFLRGAQSDSPLRSKLETGYGSELTGIVRLAGDTQAGAAHSAPRLFARAKGYDKAVKDGTMTQEEVDAEYAKFMRKFYTGSDAKSNRRRERRKLKNIIKPNSDAGDEPA